MATVFIMEAANLFAGDGEQGTAQSNHLQLTEVKLPGLEENFADHVATGAPVAVEFDTHMLRLEVTFNLAGWQREVMTLIARSEKLLQHYTIYGLIRDRRSGEAQEAIAVLEGRLGRVNPTNFRSGDLQQLEYSIRNITAYSLEWPKGNIIYDWDYFASIRMIGGIDVDEDMRTILRIPPGPRGGGPGVAGGGIL